MTFCYLQPPPTPTGSVETGRKEVVFSGHRKGVEGVIGHKGHVMALAVSSDGKFLVSEIDHTTSVHTLFICEVLDYSISLLYMYVSLAYKLFRAT